MTTTHFIHIKAAASDNRTRNLAIATLMRLHYTNFVCSSVIC